MKRVILMSFKPYWLLQILTGRKKIEFRKNVFHLKEGDEIHAYCTLDPKHKLYKTSSGYCIGEKESEQDVLLNGTVVAVIVIEGVGYDYGYHTPDSVLEDGCITRQELYDYSGGPEWLCYHIYIKSVQELAVPRQLWNYVVLCNDGSFTKQDGTKVHLEKFKAVERAPQSWQYACYWGDIK